MPLYNGLLLGPVLTSSSSDPPSLMPSSSPHRRSGLCPVSAVHLLDLSKFSTLNRRLKQVQFHQHQGEGAIAFLDLIHYGEWFASFVARGNCCFVLNLSTTLGSSSLGLLCSQLLPSLNWCLGLLQHGAVLCMALQNSVRFPMASSFPRSCWSKHGCSVCQPSHPVWQCLQISRASLLPLVQAFRTPFPWVERTQPWSVGSMD